MTLGIDPAIIEQALDGQANTGRFSHVTVIGGSDRYRNTPGIVALAALRSACDLTGIVAPEPSADNSSRSTLNVMTTALSGTHIRPSHMDALAEQTAWADCTVIGPGIGQHDDTVDAVATYLQDMDAPAVVDAGALRIMADQPDCAHDDWILTPHTAEFAALTGEEPPDDMEARKSLVSDCADRFGCTILLKGPVDVISDGDRTATNDTGNRYMSKGGTGDVLAGVAASLRAQGHDPFESACTAAYLNGRAGDHALDTYGRGFLLEEMLQSLSTVMTPEEA